MTRYSRNPILLDDCITISTADLKRRGYLSQGVTSRIIQWRRGDETLYRISITIDLEATAPSLTLVHEKTSVCQRIHLTSLPFNMNDSRVWFFVCPQTGQRCRKLHLFEGRFVHRSAIPGCLYRKQTYSQYVRDFLKPFDALMVTGWIDKKYARSVYRGKPTRRVERTMRRLEPMNRKKGAQF